MKLMLAYSSIYLFFWLVTTQANRYLIPVLPMLSLLCIGLCRASCRQHLCPPASPRFVTGALLVAAFYNLPFLFYLWWTPGKRYFTPVLGAFPESVFSDNYNPERYLSTYMGSLPAINFVNSLGNVKKVLYVGFRDGPPLFYANFPMVYNELAVYNQFVEEKDLGRLLELDTQPRHFPHDRGTEVRGRKAGVFSRFRIFPATPAADLEQECRICFRGPSESIATKRNLRWQTISSIG